MASEHVTASREHRFRAEPKLASHVFVIGAVVIAAGFTKTVVAQDTTGGRGGMPRERDTVPARAPDTTPTWFDHDSSYTTGDMAHLKRVIGITFRENTSQAARQAAVESVGGRVVGGWRLSPLREGIYAVQVADTVTDAQLDQLIDSLRMLPRIKSAVPILTSAANEYRGSRDSLTAGSPHNLHRKGSLRQNP